MSAPDPPESAEIVITPEMIEAGMNFAHMFMEGMDWHDRKALVVDIYTFMRKAVVELGKSETRTD